MLGSQWFKKYLKLTFEIILNCLSILSSRMYSDSKNSISNWNFEFTVNFFDSRCTMVLKIVSTEIIFNSVSNFASMLVGLKNGKKIKFLQIFEDAKFWKFNQKLLIKKFLVNAHFLNEIFHSFVSDSYSSSPKENKIFIGYRRLRSLCSPLLPPPPQVNI